MTQPTAILRKEHEAITGMLGAAERAAERLERNEPVRPEFLDGMSEFFSVFLDKCHHGKEEQIFFPALAKKGMPVDGGPIRVMLGEHEEGRAMASRLRALAQDYGRGNRAAGTEWAKTAREYSRLLRDHILKENNVLFPMAEGMLSPAEEEALTAQFEQMEIEKIGKGTHERLHVRMAEIVKGVGEAR